MRSAPSTGARGRRRARRPTTGAPRRKRSRRGRGRLARDAAVAEARSRRVVTASAKRSTPMSIGEAHRRCASTPRSRGRVGRRLRRVSPRQTRDRLRASACVGSSRRSSRYALRRPPGTGPGADAARRERDETAVGGSTPVDRRTKSRAHAPVPIEGRDDRVEVGRAQRPSAVDAASGPRSRPSAVRRSRPGARSGTELGRRPELARYARLDSRQERKRRGRRPARRSARSGPGARRSPRARRVPSGSARRSP